VARRAARRRLLHLVQARRRLLHLCRASGCFDTSRGLSHDSSSTISPRAGSSSTTSPTPRVRVPRHVARLVTRLVIEYFDYVARPAASARHAPRLAARRRLLRLRRVSGCLGTSRGSSHGSSSTTPCAATSSCGHTGSTSVTPCITTTCLVTTLALHQLRHAAVTSSFGRIASTIHLD
jgi:hypothetical protein